MKTSFITLATLALGAIASAQSVSYNYDTGADFSRFKTYKWVAMKDAAQVDDLTDKQIKSSLDTELAKKSLTKVEGDNADLLIGYQAAIGTEKQFTSYNSDWGYGGGWYRGGWYGSPGGGMTTGQTSTIYTCGASRTASTCSPSTWCSTTATTAPTSSRP